MTKYKKLKEYLEQIETPNDVNLKDLNVYLKHEGFSLVRTTGSHHVFADKNNEIYVIPVHNGKIKRVYIASIVKNVKENKNGI